MNNKISANNGKDLSRIGHFTAKAVKEFEENIVKEHNYLEKTNNR